jgi:hypothetical protein
MSKKTNFNHHENFTDSDGTNNKNVVIITHFEFDHSPANHCAQMFYRHSDGSMIPISDPVYSDSEVSAVIRLFQYDIGYAQTIDICDFRRFKEEQIGRIQDAEVVQ